MIDFICKWLCLTHSIQYKGIETFCLLIYILVWGYWNILSPKFIRFLNYIKSLCIIFMLNWFIFFIQKSGNFLLKNVSIPSDQNMSRQTKCFYNNILHTTDARFYISSVKIGSISFFSSSDKRQFHHLFGCQAIGINSVFNFFFQWFSFFKFNVLDEKKLFW